MFSVFEIIAFEHVAEVFLKKWRESMWSLVNVLPNSHKIPNVANTDVFQLSVSSINGIKW